MTFFTPAAKAAQMLRHITGLFSVDEALMWGLGSKIVTALSGPISAALVAYYFSPELQGYHYTFLSLTALQIFVELGLTNVVISFASHEWAALSLSPEGRICGDAGALSRLSSLAKLAFKWFAVASVILVVSLIIAGLLFLSTSPSGDVVISWRGPWIALCVVTGLNVMLVPAWAILQGCGQIHSFYYSRVVEIPLRTIAMWTAVLMSANLWTAVIASFASFAWVVCFLLLRYRAFFFALIDFKGGEKISWTQEILPLQWRIAVSWMSGYFMFSLFTPVLFHFQGSVIAGQMGMTWALISGISGLAGTWIQVKVPILGSLVAKREFPSLERTIYKAGIMSVAVTLIGASIFYVLLLIFASYAPALRGKVLPTAPILIFMVAEVLRQISLAQSSYVRAFKMEPFLVMSVVLGLTSGGAVVLCAKYLSIIEVALCYLLAIVISLFWGTRILAQFRRALTQEPVVGGSLGSSQW